MTKPDVARDVPSRAALRRPVDGGYFVLLGELLVEPLVLPDALPVLLAPALPEVPLEL